MGVIYLWQCNKCEYSFEAYLGYGMNGIFPEGVTKAAREGRYGKELKTLLTRYPGAVVDGEDVILQCEHCYRYEVRPLLATYLPEMEGSEREQYAFFWDSYGCLAESYRFFRDYEHRCRCGHRMWPIYEEECLAGLPCPYCSGTLKPEEAGYWD